MLSHKTITMYGIKNVPDYAKDHNFIVSKQDGHNLWFYGAYDTEERAIEVADTVEGVVTAVIH